MELIGTYAALGLGRVDAIVVAVGERRGATQVATLDHWDLRVVRSRQVDALSCCRTE